MITIGILPTWLTEAGNEMGKRSLKLEPTPDFVKMIGPYMYPDEREGINAHHNLQI